MEARELGIKGCWELSLNRFEDERGAFSELFVDYKFESLVDSKLIIRQANLSVSHRGVLRGLHWADVPPGQSKYVFCPQGKVLDILVDLRRTSKTFLRWEAVELSSAKPSAVYIPNGVGHGFLAIEDNTLISYFCSESYSPNTERTLNPFDERIGIPWDHFKETYDLGNLILSPRDGNAPNVEFYLNDANIEFPS
jgi:dTDP-4-dehydrorhamnose 3,5-epimerase